MNLIEKLTGKHLFRVELQPDETYFVEELKEIDELDQVLAGFQEGDVQTIAWILDYLCDDPNDNNDPMFIESERLCRRFLAMAQKMEVKE